MASSTKHHLKNKIKYGSNCVICGDCKIQGDVTIGNGTIIHPRAAIIAESGPIVIGDFNLIEDKATIINKGSSNSESASVMKIGNYNVFEVASHNESLQIGDNNILETKSVVGKEVVISNNCIIGAGCNISYPETLVENTAFYGSNRSLRLFQAHTPQVLQMEFLSKLLPTYHYLMKKKKSQESHTSTLKTQG